MIDENAVRKYWNLQTRRHFFAKAGLGLGSAALASVMGESAIAGSAPTEKNAANGPGALPHYAPKAKRAIYLFISGAP